MFVAGYERKTFGDATLDHPQIFKQWCLQKCIFGRTFYAYVNAYPN